jgi:hypothetical protein
MDFRGKYRGIHFECQEKEKKREKELEDWREIGKLKRNYAKTGLQN